MIDCMPFRMTASCRSGLCRTASGERPALAGHDQAIRHNPAIRHSDANRGARSPERLPPPHSPGSNCQTTFSLRPTPCAWPRAIHRAEHATVSDAGRRRPRIGRHLHPSRHRNRPHPAMLPDEVHDAPTAVALLDVAERERRHLGSPQPAAQEHRQDRAVAQPLGRRRRPACSAASAPAGRKASSPSGCPWMRRPSRA